MDIIFLNPPKSKNPTDHVLNMAMLWLASILKSKGIETKIFTIMGDKLEEEVVNAIEKTNPKWVSISCKWWNTLYSSLEIAKVIRKNYPSIKICTGGHTATIFAKEIIATGLIDVVLLGDSEKSIIELIVDGNISGGTSSFIGHFDENRVFMEKEFLEEQYSLDFIDGLVDRPELIPAYVWTGRGCSHNCFYCAENVETAKHIFGKRVPFLRSYKMVAQDIERLEERSHLIFDYEYPSFDKTDSYIEMMLNELPKKDYRCYFFSWGLPSKKLIDIFSEKFSYSSICIDIQTFSEDLRRKLSNENLVKPFYSNSELYELLEYVETKGNVIIDGTGVVGYPYETEIDRQITMKFIKDLHEKFQCIRDVRPSPLHVIPGTPMALTNMYYNLEVVRHDFYDFFMFTKEAFEKETPYYSMERSYHPFGVYPKGKPMVIVEFMRDANQQLDEIKNRKIRVDKKVYDNVVTVFIEDMYNPMKSLLDALNELSSGERYCNLNLSLGRFTWFHHSWIDYTSESGENCASIMGTMRSIDFIVNKLTNKFNVFDRINLKNENDPSWGVICSLVNKLNKMSLSS